MATIENIIDKGRTRLLLWSDYSGGTKNSSSFANWGDGSGGVIGFSGDGLISFS